MTQPLFCPDASELPQVVLKKKTSHPNIFRKRIEHIEGNPQAGDWVAVYYSDEELATPELFAYGLYNSKSEIAVRLARWSKDAPGEGYWNECISRAISLREDALSLDDACDCYRLLHAEADGVPGLVVDRYANVLSAEVFSIAMAQRAEELLVQLSKHTGTSHWLIQPGPHLQSQEGYVFAARQSEGLPKQVDVHEYGTKFIVRFDEGHKTGFFCDQRDNRQQLARWSAGKSVLDVCCYTGGFAVTAAAAGKAAQVIGVDIDSAPLELARKNAARNQVQVKFTQADAFSYMRDMLRAGKQYDVVVLDPPKLIRNRAELEDGTRKHFDLNRLAMQLVRPGGMMLTCSCAGLLHEADFTKLVRAAAWSAFQPSELNPRPVQRNMQIIAKAGAAGCHPVSANCPETEYLKAMWLRL